jgi:hypothetical protein
MKLAKGINPSSIEITKEFQINYKNESLQFQSGYSEIVEVEKDYICIIPEPYLLSILEKIQTDINTYVGKEVLLKNYKSLLPNKIRSYKKWINKFYRASIKEDNKVYISLKYSEIYNKQKEKIKIEDIKIGNKIRCIYEISKLWINENGFGISLQVIQGQIK